MEQKILTTDNLQLTLTEAISECEHERIFVLTDEITRRKCWPLMQNFLVLRDASVIEIPATDVNKNLDSLSHVWKELAAAQATRHALLINLGGGMVTDLGGFAASTYKRGIDFINIPTTLLSMVDASVGGKTGINFEGLKNEIGVFNTAQCVIFYMPFLKTLDTPNLLSGYAEMLKHGLLDSEETWAEVMNLDLRTDDMKKLSEVVMKSVGVKQRIVKADPKERGLRKALNLGHTFGHAFEEFSLRHDKKPILHGHAVAYGLVADLYLSSIRFNFPVDKMRQTIRHIFENYEVPSFSCDDYPELIELMRQDKKNHDDRIITTLLADIGQPRIDQIVSEEEIKEALDFCREG
ncbi:MAG: 3-dehydroquinate synthase [Prevotella sp.]|jgi:3-dehydroquinate synthase